MDPHICNPSTVRKKQRQVDPQKSLAGQFSQSVRDFVSPSVRDSVSKENWRAESTSQRHRMPSSGLYTYEHTCVHTCMNAQKTT